MGDRLDGLRNYLEKYASLAENRKQSIDTVGNEFTEIRNISAELKKKLATAEGAKEVNRKKNRYKDILPYDATRVKLEVSSFNDGSDYINANFIKDHKNKKCYIASQGPMPHTINDFWKMIWQYEVKLIIMACKEIELGKPRCQRYWALEMGGPEEKFGDIGVKLFCETQVAQNMYLRELVVTRKNAQRHISQLHYMDWPDHGAPETYETILHLLKLARKKQPHDNTPLLIHCSAGCGRTGAIIAIDYARKIIEERMEEISVLKIVKHLREQRPAMVQTKEQYEFIYEVVRELVTKELKEYDEEFQNCSPDATYENIQFILKDKPYSSSSNNVRNLINDIPRSQSVEEVFRLDQTQTNRRQIILPTEHVINTNNFRRTRSHHQRHAATASARPPVPRKASEVSSTSHSPSNSPDSVKQGKAAMHNSPSRTFEYENITPNTKISTSSSDSVSPIANEEFIPQATPVGLSSYPMKTQLLNVSSIEHKHNAIKQTRSHDALPYNSSSIPSNTLLSAANEKLKKSRSASDILSDERKENSKHFVDNDGLYAPVVKGNRVIHKPPAPVLGSSERNRSSVKKGIIEDQTKTKNENTGFTSWTASIELSPPALPERTPESYIIDEPPEGQENSKDLEPTLDYTPISSIVPSTSQPNQAAYKNLISQAPPSEKSSNWNPLSKMFGRNRNSEERNSATTNTNSDSEQKSNSLPSPNNRLGFGIRLKRKPKGPRDMPVKFGSKAHTQ